MRCQSIRLTSSMKATNVMKIQIRLFVEDNQQLKRAYKKIHLHKIIFAARHKSNTKTQ